MKSVKIRALLDTNVFIYAYEIPRSNSSLMICALNKELFDAIITESTFKEVYRYFRRHYLKDLADLFRLYLFASCRLIFTYELKRKFAKYSKLINKKDLEQVVAVRELGIKYLVSYDRDFEGVEEYIIPRGFVRLLGLKPYSVDY